MKIIDNCIYCDNCDIWYHIECQKISKKELDLIEKLKDKIKWYCDSCIDEEKFVIQQNKNLRETEEKLSEKIDVLYAEIEKRKTADKNNPNAKANKNESKKISSNKEKQLSNVYATDCDE